MDLLFAAIFFIVCLRLLHELLSLHPHTLLLPAALLTLIGYPVLKALIFEFLRPFFMLADPQVSPYLVLAIAILAVILVVLWLIRRGSLFGRDPFGHF